MSRVPSIPSAALRDHGGTERVERIWRRTQPDLLAAPRNLPRPSPAVWIPAALAATFAAGIFVGAKWTRTDHETTLSAERPVAPEPAARPAAAPQRTATPTEEPRAPQAKKNRSLDIVEPTELMNLAPPEALPPVALMQSVPAAPLAWEQLADDDRYDEARAALEASGGFSTALANASATQLMTLADIARRTGSRDQAILAWRRIVEAFPAAAEAPIAAWTLGRQLEDLGDTKGAADAYELYRRLSPSGDFAEDALARQVDSALATGNVEELARLVAQYENAFPNGSRLEEFRAELAKRSAGGATEPNGSTSGVPTALTKDPAAPEASK
jgi:tetratricopeptide (TPR) repeat protein